VVFIAHCMLKYAASFLTMFVIYSHRIEKHKGINHFPKEFNNASSYMQNNKNSLKDEDDALFNRVH
jgi:hypothetical protein